MVIQYQVAVQNDSNLVIAVGIANDQGGKDYPIQGTPKVGVWDSNKFNTCPACSGDNHIELIDNEIVIVPNE